MSASSFLGLPVSCTLSNGSSIQGLVASIDAIQGTITLSDATLKRANGEVSYLASQVLSRTEVTGLQVISVNKGSPRSSDGARRPSSQQPSGSQGGTPTRSQLAPQFDQSPIPSTSASASREPSSREPSPKIANNGGGKRKTASKKKSGLAGRKVAGGNEADVSEAYDGDEGGYRPSAVPSQPSLAEEFDFSAGLRSFDKAAVFEQIRSQDTIDPSLRLHAHNKIRKLAPNENVLSQHELDLQKLEVLQLGESTASASEYEEEKKSAVADKGKGKKNGPTSTAQVAVGKGSGFVTKSGVSVPTVKLREWKEVIGIADIESGPTSVQRLESFSLLLSQYILSTLASRHYLGQKPNLCLLVSAGEKGATVLRMGAWCAMHGAKVVALLVEGGGGGDEFRSWLRGFSSAGGRVLRELSDLGEDYDLIVEALSENQVGSGSQPKTATQAAIWATEIGLPLISIDTPFGLDHDTGLPLVSQPLSPDFIVCRGAIRSGCTMGKAELVVVDVGVGSLLWRRVGVESLEESTWGGEWVVGVKRVGKGKK